MEDYKWIKEQVAAYVYSTLGISDISSPEKELMENHNVWIVAVDFENKTGLDLNDGQLKRCRTVGQLVDMLSSVAVLSSTAQIAWLNQTECSTNSDGKSKSKITSKFNTHKSNTNVIKKKQEQSKGGGSSICFEKEKVADAFMRIWGIVLR